MKNVLILFLVLPMLAFSQNNYKKIEGYKFLSKIDAPEGHSIFAGQISKDMKKYYLPAVDANNKPYMFVYQIDSKGKASFLSKHFIEIPEGKDFAGQISVTEDEKTIVFTLNSENEWDNNDLCMAEIENRNKSYVKARILGEINDDDVADAYATISADGLRIFWVKDNTYFTASRKERNHAFGKKTEMNSLSKSFISGWISPDEQTIYTVEHGIVNKTSRKNTESEFTALEVYSEAFSSIEFVSAYNETKSKMAFVYISLSDGEDSMSYTKFIGIYKKK